VVGVLADDPSGADTVNGGVARRSKARWSRSALLGTARRVATALAEQLDTIDDAAQDRCRAEDES
jgi:hypothetical protein